jgi:LysM repeat protein
MKIPLFSKLTAKSRGRKVVRASARAMRGGEDDYYEAEPNMKLSHAFMVVLILHIVAVGGIYAFNQIKVNKNANLLGNISSKISQATGGAVPAVAAASSTVASAAANATPFAPATPELRRMPGDADEPLPMVGSSSPAAADPAPVVKTQPAAPAAPAPLVTQTAPAKAAATKPATAVKPAVTTTKAEPAVASSATYKVAKGDNPYKIAKKLGVTPQELLKANNIDDPTKLQIGQVLKVPGKAN